MEFFKVAVLYGCRGNQVDFIVRHQRKNPGILLPEHLMNRHRPIPFPGIKTDHQGHYRQKPVLLHEPGQILIPIGSLVIARTFMGCRSTGHLLCILEGIIYHILYRHRMVGI